MGRAGSRVPSQADRIREAPRLPREGKRGAPRFERLAVLAAALDVARAIFAALGFALKRDEAAEERLSYEEMRKKLTETLKRAFRPEFINRLDSVIVFRALNKENIQKIVKLELDKVAARLTEHNITLTATPEALSSLGAEGFDPEMGARPLRRAIQKFIESPLSVELLSKKYEQGGSVTVDVENDKMAFR